MIAGSPRRVVRVALGVAAVLALLAGAYFAGRQSVSLAAVAGAKDTPTAGDQWTVRTQTVGRTLTFDGRLTATTAKGALANADGVITGLRATPGTRVSAGEVLMTVDLRPIVAGQGSVPAFRDLQEGDEGPDVRQLRAFLCGLGNPVCSDNSEFTAAMTTAVEKWQKALGVPADGVVKSADIMWFPTLPVRVYPAEDVAVGNPIAAADRPLLYQTAVADLDVPVTDDQAALIPNDARVSFGDGVQGVTLGTEATTGDASDGDAASLRLVVRAPNKTDPVCKGVAACDTLLGSAASAAVTVAVDVVPETSGPAVPVRAIRSGADGKGYVVCVDGRRLPVTVVGSSGGISIVEGVSVGTRVRLDGGG